ncbi:hypothetical protein VTI74DRAFT_4955 [Chaetomium olivicolor]
MSPNQPPAPSLTTLPLDLLFALSALLDYPSLLALSCTCRSLRAALNPDALLPLADKIACYQRAEQCFPQHADKLVCFSCWRFLPTSSFGDSKRRGKWGRRGRYSFQGGDWGMLKTEGWRQAGTRFCFECGVTKRLYAHGRMVKWQGLGWYPCHECRRAVRAGRKMCVWVSSRGSYDPEAEDDLKWGCVLQVEREKAPLERLPPEVIERVCGFLGYRDLIRLKAVSRHFRGAVDPVKLCTDVHGMWEFVNERMNVNGWGPRDWNVPVACAGCFRPRKRSQFSFNQLYPRRAATKGEAIWRRRCWECLRRFYHPHLADTEARDRFNRQTQCRRCKGLRYVDEDCRGCGLRMEDIEEWARIKRAKIEARGNHDVWEESEPLFQWFDEATTASSQQENYDIWGGLSETFFGSVNLWEEEHLDTASYSGSASSSVAGTSVASFDDNLGSASHMTDPWEPGPEEGMTTMAALGQGSGLQGEVLAH